MIKLNDVITLTTKNGDKGTAQIVEENNRFNIQLSDGSLLVDWGWETLEMLQEGLNHSTFYVSWEVKEENNHQAEEFEALTEKEQNVLKVMLGLTYEFGLPVEVDEIKEETGYTKRTIVGVIGSLYKKELVESYDMDLDNEFMLSEKGYDVFN